MAYIEQKDAENKTGKLFYDFQQILDEKLGKQRTEVEALVKNSQLDGESKAVIDRIQVQLNEQAQQLKTLQIAFNAPRGYDSPEAKADAEAKDRKAAFETMLRYGTINAVPQEARKYIQLDAQSGMESKALYNADNTTGGFLATPEYVNQLLKNIVLVSPMADIVDMRVTAKPWVMTPRRTQTASAVRVAEQATRTETQNPRFGLMQNFPYESYAFTLVSRTDLDDSELDLSSFLMQEFSEQFAVLQGREYISGLGSSASQSFGFLNDLTINNNGNGTVTTQSAGALDYASLVKVKQSLKPGYLPNATWIWTNETLGAIQMLTDNQGRPLWVPFGGTLPDTIFGRPYRIMPDMPQMAANGGSAGALAIAFGDFKNGYQGVIRKQISMQVLQERYADQNAVGYFGYFRFGGTTKISEAIKTLKVHA
jgi:HK97 family phage major capsid protein